MASSYTAMYLQMRQRQRLGRGEPQEPGARGMMAPSVRSTATVAPRTSPSAWVRPLSHRGLGSHSSTPTAAATSAESFAAALRKLAKLAEDPQDSRFRMGKVLPPVVDRSSPGSVPVRPLSDIQHPGIPPSCQTPDPWIGEVSQTSQKSKSRMCSQLPGHQNACSNVVEPAVKLNFKKPEAFMMRQNRGLLPTSASHLLKNENTAASPRAGCYFPGSPAHEGAFSPLSAQKAVPQMVSARGHATDGYPMGFHPYISREGVRPLPTYPGLPIDSAAMPSSYLYPAFLPHLQLHPSLCRLDEPYYLPGQTALINPSNLSAFSTLYCHGLFMPTGTSDTTSTKRTALRWTREETNLHRARDKMVTTDSQLKPLGDGGESKLPKQREGRRMRKDLTEKKACSKERTVRQEKNQDVPRAPRASPTPRFSWQNSGGPYHSISGLQSIEQGQGQDLGSRASLLSINRDPKKYFQLDRTMPSLQNENDLRCASISSPPSPFMLGRDQPLSPPCRSMAAEAHDHLDPLQCRHSHKEDSLSHISLRTKSKPDTGLKMKSYDNGSPKKARKDKLPRNRTLFTEGSKAYLIEQRVEPPDCPQIMEFSQRGKLKIHRDRDKRLYLKTTEDASSYKNATKLKYNPKKNSSLAVIHHCNSTLEHQFSSMPDLLTHVPHFNRADYEETLKDLLVNGGSSKAEKNQKHTLEKDVTRILLEGQAERKTGVQQHQSPESDGNWIIYPQRSNAQQDPYAQEPNQMDMNGIKSMKRELPYNYEQSTHGNHCKKVNRRIERHCEHHNVKTCISAWSESDSQGSEVVCWNRQKWMETGCPTPVMQETVEARVSPADSHNWHSREPTTSQDNQEKNMFFALLDLKPHTSFDQEDEESILSFQSVGDEREEELVDLSISSSVEEAKCKDMSSGSERVLQPQWHSIEAILETYRDYMEEREVEQKVLQEQLRLSKEKNKQLILTVERLGTQLQDLETSKEILGREQRCQEAVLACVRKCFVLQSS